MRKLTTAMILFLSLFPSLTNGSEDPISLRVGHRRLGETTSQNANIVLSVIVEKDPANIKFRVECDSGEYFKASEQSFEYSEKELEELNDNKRHIEEILIEYYLPRDITITKYTCRAMLMRKIEGKITIINSRNLDILI